MLLGEVVLDRANVLLVHRLVRRRFLERGEQIGGARRRREVFRPRPREEPRHEVGARLGQLDDRLVHQMRVQVAAPDVDDERHPRLERHDVREVLIGRDAEVDAAALHLPQRRHDMLKRTLVRHEVVRLKCAVRLGKILDELPELLVGEPRRQRLGRGRRLRDGLPGRPRQPTREQAGGERAASRTTSFQTPSQRSLHLLIARGAPPPLACRSAPLLVVAGFADFSYSLAGPHPRSLAAQRRCESTSQYVPMRPASKSLTSADIGPSIVSER